MAYLITGFLYLAPHLNKLLQLNSISLTRFKNYALQSFSFQERITGICGPNGVGKTNLLDAIYYLCFTKSYFGRTDAQNALSGFTGFRIEGNFSLDGTATHAVCILRDPGKKEFLVNGSAYEKFASHIGKFPCVIIAPDDVRMITEGSEERRRFFDALISQLDPDYLQNLISYNKLLQQRNSYLKTIAETRTRDLSLLDVYDQQLANDGWLIYQKRKLFLHNLIPLAISFYQSISGAEETVEIQYESQLHHKRFPALLAETREKDLFLQRTSAGIHKDDLIFRLNGQPFKLNASQGQRKSLLFALKLSEFQSLKDDKHFAPLLLLDDVFEKLDEKRMHNLLDWVCVQNEGQIFITDTHAARIGEHFRRLDIAYQLLEL